MQAFPHAANRETFPTLALLEGVLGQEPRLAEVDRMSTLGGCKILEEIGSVRWALSIVLISRRSIAPLPSK